MTSLNNEGRFVLAIRSLSQNIYQRILPLMPKFCDTAQEIRLRVNRPVAIVCPDTTYFLTEKGGLTNAILDGAMLTVSRGDLTDTFHNICNYSVYSKQSEIVNGFVTMHGGHRAGICGTAICEGDRIIKYGETIGYASRMIEPGEHVHVHNMVGGRGRGDLE